MSIPFWLLKVIDILDSDCLYTIDLGFRKDREWVLIEIGDGQVSSLKENSVQGFYNVLTQY